MFCKLGLLLVSLAAISHCVPIPDHHEDITKGIIIIPGEEAVYEIVQANADIIHVEHIEEQPFRQKRKAAIAKDDVIIIIIMHDEPMEHEGDVQPVRILSTDGEQDEIDEDAAIYTGTVIEGENGEKTVQVIDESGDAFEVDYFTCLVVDSDDDSKFENTIFIIAKPIIE